VSLLFLLCFDVLLLAPVVLWCTVEAIKIHSCATMLSFSQCLGFVLVVFLTAAPPVLADDAAAAADNYEDGYLNQFSVCKESTVLVKDVSIMCDSPGAYYYGSNKYRNSASCQAGDKANLLIDLVILQDLEDDAFLTMKVKGYGSVESISLYDQNSFCDSVKPVNGVECPEAGYYVMSERFYWGSQSDSYEYTFVPKVVVGISSAANQKYYDLGGANTDQCYSGNTFNAWTEGVRKSAADSFVTFMLTFGTLLAVLVVIGLVAYFLIKQANKKRPKKEVIVDEELDEASYQAIRDHKTLVDPSVF